MSHNRRRMSAALKLAFRDGGDMPDNASRLRERIAARSAKVAVIGLGHVGLPLATAIARHGFPTFGYDTDRNKLSSISAGREPVRDLESIEMEALLQAKKLLISSEACVLDGMDVLIICVPTPLAPDRGPDLQFVEDATRQVAMRLRPGSLVILESTTWPGSTRQIVIPLLETSGLRFGVDFFVAFSPEREDPGNAHFNTASTPKLVAGADATSLALSRAFYESVVERVVPVLSMEVAEAAKLTENVFRAVNIGLANELKLVFEAAGIDIWQVMEAAATKPFGFMPFWPGPGVGGHCIPVDPLYLTWAARKTGVPARLIELATSINEAMPAHVVARLVASLARRGRALEGARILILGVGYKRNQDDCRESPGIVILEAIERAGGDAAFYDPVVAKIPMAGVPESLAGRAGIVWSSATLRRFDAAIIVTDHTRVDYGALVETVPLVLDTRNVCARLGLHGPGIVQA